jgi:thioredoxin 1
MSYAACYAGVAPLRSEIDRLRGWVLLEFGAPWCGHCRVAQKAVEAVLEEYSCLQHVKIEDGKGQPLGRSFSVKLWPTVILLKDGEEAERIVRPTEVHDLQAIRRALGKPHPGCTQA